MNIKKKLEHRKRAKLRIRKKVFGVPSRPRLSIFRSLTQIYAQVIDDVNGKTLLASSSFEKNNRMSFKGKKKTEVSYEIGKQLGQKAIALGINEVVFDRNGYAYHGRVKALAEGAREGGLIF